eukprot:TRINITY_DN1858_c0_g1_i1.p1 TRINITY_DN1858_c0_g1~~TRINITY_DN1858_c0_g1_i1.p1  ORF type:complete len:226 (+),score=41.99 TRINITY_DN1858_c0_g1_i1:77-679(+)
MSAEERSSLVQRSVNISGEERVSVNYGTSELQKYVAPVWFTAKHLRMYQSKLKVLQQRRDAHLDSARYFERLEFWIIGPSIIISALSGIASFLSTSSSVTGSMQTNAGILVGCLASVATLLQSISGSCQFGVKSEAHRTAAEEYEGLITRIRFEIDMPNEENFADQLEQDILQIQSKCKFFPPDHINAKYLANYSDRMLD